MEAQIFNIEPFFISTLVAFLISFIPGFIYLRIKNIAILDIFWPIFFLSHAIVNFIYYNSYNFAQYIVFIFILIWGLSLFYKLYSRGIKHNFYDKRYDSIKNNWQTPNIAGICYCNFQSAIASIFCISIQMLFHMAKNNYISIVGIILLIAGLIIELIADDQVKKFKEKNKDKKSFCNKGLWSISRHPNYFGEILFWFGFAITSFLINLNILSFILPILLLLLFYKITVPIAEKLSIKKYGEKYIDYQRKTPMIFPKKYFTRN